MLAGAARDATRPSLAPVMARDKDLYIEPELHVILRNLSYTGPVYPCNSQESQNA